jgi:nicotinic acid mononucleotide adenylyltransferase
MPDISSRSLRSALGESDYPAAVDRKMPKSVADYIMTHGLYQSR